MMFLLEFIPQLLYLTAKVTAPSIFIFQSMYSMSIHSGKAVIMHHHLKSEEELLNRQKQDFVTAFVLEDCVTSPAFQPAAFLLNEALRVKPSRECLFLPDGLTCHMFTHQYDKGWKDREDTVQLRY